MDTNTFTIYPINAYKTAPIKALASNKEVAVAATYTAVDCFLPTNNYERVSREQKSCTTPGLEDKMRSTALNAYLVA